MRTIGHCVHGLGLGGAQLIVKQIVAGCDGFRHVVYSPTDGVLRGDVERAGATVRIVPRLLPKVDPIWVRRLTAAMRHDRVDMVHGHLFGDVLHGHFSARRAGGLPMIMTLHSPYEFSTPLQRLGYRWLLRRCDGAVACCDSVGRSFVQAKAARSELLVTIRNGIDDPMTEHADPGVRQVVRRELGLDPEAVVIASIGRLAPEKGHIDLLDAHAQLVRQVSPQPRLVLFGDGPLRAQLQRRVHDLGIAPFVLFAGFRPNVSRFLPACDVVAISSLFEGCSVAMLEAMATGRCIVGTDIPGVVEAARPDREALIVPVRNVELLREALRQAVSSPDLRERLGAAARRRFLKLFTAQQMARAYREFYRAIGEQPYPRAA